MQRILIIEDDTDINHLIREALFRSGYTCVQAFSGTEGLLLAKEKGFQVIVLDLMLPGRSGKEILAELKAIEDTPVLILTSIDSLDSKLELLTGGADDYMTKPFSLEELVARINILAKRKTATKPTTALHFKELTLDTQNYTAAVNGQALTLTRSEFQILELLLRHPQRVFTKQDIYESVWNEFYVSSDKTINVHISNIRKKLKQFSESEYIDTVWGIGFKLKS